MPPTPLIGRDDELAAVLTLLRQPAVRLVTLTGLGGTGKTRLALEAATTMKEDVDETLFVDLAPVQDPKLVGSAIAGVLGVRETPDRPLSAAIAERLGDARMLIFLDDFGHVLPAAALIDEILAAAPGLKVLATSRTPLRIRGEREYAVQPLAVPGLGDITADSPAVRLFAERAQEVKPSFELTDENVEAVAEICRRLEGIPLAIELAAARVKLLTPAQILGRLEEKRLSFLSGGGDQQDDASRRDRVEPQPARRARASRSSPASAVFVGGTSLETAENVAGQPLGLEFGEVLDSIASLVDNGLVRQVESGRRRAAIQDARDDPRVRARAARRARRARGRAQPPSDPVRRARRDRRAGAHPREPGRLARAAERGERQHPRRASRGRSSPARSSSGCGSPARSCASGASAG